MELKNKRILVVGMGRSGLAAAKFLRRHGAQVTVSDARSAVALASEIPALVEAGIMVEAGGHGLLTFRRQDLIVVSPGVPLQTPELVQSRAFGLPIIGELELASYFLRGSVLAITGSNGKTTTTTLIGEILTASGQPTQVGGNIGVPVVELIDSDTQDGWSVLEVSSFQLETVERFHPRIAVILNITPDHLDRHGSFENYALAKERIFHAQTADDMLILNADNPRTAACAERAHSSVWWFSLAQPVPRGTWVADGRIHFRTAADAPVETILVVAEIPLKGAHNIENALAAICAARLANVSTDIIAQVVRGFRAVEHRIEFVACHNGVEYYNDSKATNVDAAAKAIAAFPAGIHLILGGRDKNSTYSDLEPLLRARVRAVYTIGSAAAKIESQIRGIVPIQSCETLERAVAAASAAALSGEVILLSPACSSFDQFANYEERGRLFKQYVRQLAGHASPALAETSR